MFQIKRAGSGLEKNVRQNREGEMEYLTFPSFEATGMVEHLFSTRLGGVSRGIYSSMNLSFTRGDNPKDVLVNYERIAAVLRCSVQDMVLSQQTHTVNIRLVTNKDRGKGIVRPLDYQDVDGLITCEKGIVLVTGYADCVPLYFLDPVHEAIGLAHSGWRGTASEMGRHMVEAMEQCFGSRPEELLAAIGPSICRDCYEVDGNAAESFRTMSEESPELLEELTQSARFFDWQEKPLRVLTPGRRPGKYQLDLWLANLLILRKAGIPLDRITVTDICTCHNPEYLFSHRATGGKRGNLGAFLMLKQN